MIYGKKIVVVLPAYNAEKTLEQTVSGIPDGIVDDLVLVDDSSKDHTIELASRLGIQHIIRHEKNMGYGANQKTCYDKALSLGADVIVMLHPDYQYSPPLLYSMAGIIATGVYPAAFGSRILGKGALRGGMPRYKYLANRVLTLVQNALMNQKLSEYHTGYRAYGREVLEHIDYHSCSDDFIFDNEMVAKIFAAGYEIAEITCPTRYFKEASSINFFRSIVYGLGVLGVSLKYRFGFYKNQVAKSGEIKGTSKHGASAAK